MPGSTCSNSSKPDRVQTEGTMAFHPDILVTSPEESRVAIVIEAKVHIPDLERTEQELKQYMVGMQCPVGLLITPEHLRLYRDFYTDRSARSVQRIGEYNATLLWAQPPPHDEARFEIFVQHCLPPTPDQPTPRLPPDIGQAVPAYDAPARRPP